MEAASCVVAIGIGEHAIRIDAMPQVPRDDAEAVGVEEACGTDQLITRCRNSISADLVNRLREHRGVTKADLGPPQKILGSGNLREEVGHLVSRCGLAHGEPASVT